MTTQFLEEIFAMQDCLAINAPNPTDIKWSDAITWAKRFRQQFGDKQIIGDKKVKGYLMSRGNIDDLLSQDGLSLQGIKIYLGIDENGVFRVIIVGVKGSKGIDYIVPENETIFTSTPTENLPSIGEVRPCPEWCGKPNVLNEG
jgi:hypothetical protein